FVKKHFLLSRMLLGLGAPHPSLAEMSSADDFQSADAFRAMGENAATYWTEASLQRGHAHMTRMAAWLVEHPPGTYSDYYYMHRPIMDDDAASGGGAATAAGRNSFYAGRTVLQHDDYTELPPGWHDQNPDKSAANETLGRKRKYYRPYADEQDDG